MKNFLGKKVFLSLWKTSRARKIYWAKKTLLGKKNFLSKKKLLSYGRLLKQKIILEHEKFLGQKNYFLGKKNILDKKVHPEAVIQKQMRLLRQTQMFLRRDFNWKRMQNK